MAEIQSLTAAISLVKLALDTADLIYRVFRGAENEAETLVRRTKHVAKLASIVEEVTERRRTSGNPDLGPVCEVIESSVLETRKSLCAINDQLQPFQAQASVNLVQKFLRNSRWMHLEKIRVTHEGVLDDMRLNLIFCVTLLNLPDMRIDHDRYLITAHAVNESVQQDPMLLRRVSTTDSTCSDSDDPMITAAKKNDAATIRRLIGQNVNVDFQCSRGLTPIHHAAKRLNLDALVALLQSPSARDVLDTRSKEGQTALMMVTFRAENILSIPLAAALLESGCDPNLEDGADRSALFHAIDRPCVPQSVALARLLCVKGADFESLRTRLPSKFEEFRPHVAPTIMQMRRRNSINGAIASMDLISRVRNLLRTFVHRTTALRDNISSTTTTQLSRQNVQACSAN